MTNPNPVDDNQPAANVDPANAAGQPLPGQPEPGQQPASSDPQDDNDGDNRGNLGVALREEREKTQALKAELEILKQIAGDNVLFDVAGRPVPKAPQQQTPQNQQDYTAQMEKMWEDDPRKAVQMEIMSAMTWRDSLEAGVDQQEMEAANKYKDFNKYRDTVRQYVKALPLDQRAKPGVVDLAYYVVKGQQSNNIYEQAQQELLRKIKAGEQVQGLAPGTHSQPPQQKGPTLTAEQLAVAEAMGLSPEDYISAMPKQAGR
jgi:hypothetical protein